MIVSTTAIIGVSTLIACTTDYQNGTDDPNFGAPNGLEGKKQPGPSSDTTDVSTGGGAAAAACVKAGGGLIEAGTCPVSFANGILKAFETGGCTATACHGGATPPNQPRIDPKDGPGTWGVFAGFKLTNGKLYINPCSTDKAQSGIAANINPSAPAEDTASAQKRDS